jgi:glycerol-3-phosphate dehydrogenase
MPYPERICLELLEDGEAAHEHAHALNYVSLSGGKGDSVELRDELTGETYTVKPRILINAAGPWIDFANDAIGKATHYIGGTKGSHVIVDHPELYKALDGTEFFFENNDGRIVLMLPFVDGRVMIGTTDIRIDNPDDAVCNETEIAYFLEMVDRVFPTIKLERSHIVFSFSGVRPLVSSEAGFTGNVSRDHHIKIDEPGAEIRFPVMSLIGGKWTSYRAFAEQTADVVLARLGRPRRCSTAGMRIGGGKDYPQDEAALDAWLTALHEKTGIDVDRLRNLFERYGTRASDIAGFMAQGDSDSPLVSKPNYTRRELVYLVRTERVIHLEDVVLRRTLMAWLGGFTDAVLREVADVVAEELKWSAERKEEEVRRTAQLLSERHHVKLESPVA